MSEHFCLDADVLISAWLRDYTPRVFPTVWDFLAGARDHIILIQPIFEEIEPVTAQDRKMTEADFRSRFPLRSWLEAHDFVATELPTAVQLRSLQLERKYEVSDISKGCSVNDMALIAYALEFDAAVVTGEGYQVNRPGEKRNYKIPLVCKEEGVEYLQFVPMLERLGFGR